jgi:glycosyltransferase involved in cell wall biosynthesis
MAKISVNIPVYNDEKYVRETLKSVLDQTFKDIEVIVIDDGSADRTGEIVGSFKDPRLKYYYQDNSGIGAARNTAISKSAGEYIAFLDHDDLWLPEKLEKQMALFENNPRLGLVFCDATLFNEKRDLYRMYASRKPPRGMVFRELLADYFLSLDTVVIRRSVLEDVGLFPSHMMMAEECDLFLRIAYKYPFDYIDEPLARYRVHKKNYSHGRDLQGIMEERETLENLRKWIPGFENDFNTESSKRRRALLIREARIYWRDRDEKGRMRIFKQLFFKEKVGFKTVILFVISSFVSYKFFNRALRLMFPRSRILLFEAAD